MSLRFLDSFDHYTTLTQKWLSVSGVGTQIQAGSLRTGIAGCRVVHNVGSATGLTLTIDAQGTWILGFAYRVGGFVSAGVVRTLDVGATQGELRQNADGTLSLLRGAAVVATSANALLANVFYYVEFKHVIDNAAGTLEVRVDGAVWATFAGDTQNTVNPTANQLQWPAIAGTFEDIDDLYICDGTGAAPNNNYWGNTQIECIVPTGAGTYTEWTTLFGAPTHWQAEDEIPPDEDTSYVESPTLNQRDTYAMGNLAVVSATINGIQVLMRGRTTLAGVDNLARLYRGGGVDYQGADVPLQTSYNYVREIMETDPNAGPGPWVVAAINAAEFGARVR